MSSQESTQEAKSLDNVSPKLTKEKILIPLLQQVLTTAVEILDADKGNIQLYNQKENFLKIVVHIGFNQQFLEHFRIVTPGYACCGVALKRRKRVIIEDISKDKDFEHLEGTFKYYGLVGCQSIPLLGGDKEVLGVLSTHFKKPFKPQKEKLKLLDTYLEKIQPIIDRRIKETS